LSIEINRRTFDLTDSTEITMGRLDNKTALVTGAARGIGEAVCETFVREGATVLLSDLRDELGHEVADRLGAAATYEHLDVREESDWMAVTDAVIERLGRLDILVNNAGITGFDEDLGPHDPEQASLAAWRAVHATNLDGVFLGCKHAIRVMRPSGKGSIVNVSSRSGVVGQAGAAAYASSKSAVRNHTRSVALYCAQEGLEIRCNSVLPAAILTPMWEAYLGEGEEREERMRSVARGAPMGRWGTPAEVAEAVVFLASDASSYMTGAEIHLDGGILAGEIELPPEE
jgi:NAD(P)-dependent dehydrogenase (short-subunit alcohol dehydrogenase family)